MRLVDLTGKKFGRLTVVARAENCPLGAARWHCRCRCGGNTIVHGAGLRKGKSQSCGCLQKERTSIAKTIHGHWKGGRASALYIRWRGMIARCENSRHKQYKDYGGRGIAVCDRWHSFEAFAEDMGEPPTPKHELDRYPNNDGNYEPGNARWATREENQNNKRTNHLLELDGITMTVAEWERHLKLPKGAIGGRLAKGMSERDALTVGPGGLKAARSQVIVERMGAGVCEGNALDDNPFNASMRADAWAKGWRSAAEVAA